MSAPPGWEGLLDDGEEILWQGRPDGSLRFTGSIFESVFGLFFGGFALFWIVMAGSMAGDAPGPFRLFPLFGLPFLAVGLYMLGGRFVWDAFQRQNTWYTLTDRRAFIARNLLGKRSLQSWDIDRFGTLELVQGPPDTIWFAAEWRSTENGSTRQRIGFRYIDDGRHVYDLMRRLQRKDPT